MYTQQEQGPNLIEPGTRNYITNILGKCHENRAKLYLFSLNAGVFLIFIVLTGLILYGCYKSRKTPEEMKQKEIEDQAYILSKIRHYKRERDVIASKSSMTGLPLTPNALSFSSAT